MIRQKADPYSAQAKRDLSVSLERLGDVEVQAHLAAVAEVLGQLARAIGDSGGRGADVTAAKDDAASAVSPYPGLEVFDEDRAAFFFGRRSTSTRCRAPRRQR